MINLKSLSLLFFLIIQLAHAEDSIGTVSFIRGSVAAVLNGNAPRLLGKGSSIFQADNIETSAQSFIIIDFKEGSKITIRPNSRFSIKEYSLKQEKGLAKMVLHKGGVRINNDDKKSNKFQIKTPVETITAEKSAYSIRLCKKDCEEETQTLVKKSPPITEVVIARVVRIEGKIQVKNTQKKISPRNLKMGAALYEGDYLTSKANSHAVLTFRDGGRVTMQANTEYKINNYQYQTQTQDDKSIQTLIKGGLRILTGKIGKIKKEDYQLNTPVATIGIRGTGFDLYCVGSCVNRHNTGAKEGLFARVWLGSIYQKNKQAQAVLKSPKVSYIANDTSPIVMLTKLPNDIQKNLAIRPDKLKIDEDLFNIKALNGIPEGLYITVHEGYLQLDQSKFGLGKHEQAYINTKGQPVRIEKQVFQEQDYYPLPSGFDEQQAEVGDYSLLRNNYRDQAAPVYECVAE